MTKSIPRVTKAQELVYELNTEVAMSKDIISVSPTDAVSGIRDILKSKRISGLPVTEDGELVGIVSIEDFIEWICSGSPEQPVSSVMSRKVETVYADEPLVHAVNLLERHGFGRLPVTDRSRRLVGIITKGDIIATLLHVLDLDYQEEEIRNYRASQFFDDLVADETRLSFRYLIQGRTIAEGGSAASALKKTLKRLGVHPSVVRRASIAAYEAEMNVIIYAKSGKITAEVDRRAIRLLIEDEGPGIDDTDLARKPGYSTAPEWVRELGFGAGMGLANIEGCADEFILESTVGTGTILDVVFLMEERCA